MFKTLIARINTPDPAPPWNLTTVVITLAVAFILPIIGTLVGAAWFPNDADPLALTPLAQLVGWLIGALLTALFVIQTRRQSADRAALQMVASSAPLPLIAFIAFGLAVAVDLVGLIVTGVSVRAPELASFGAFTPNFLTWGVAIVFMLAIQPVADGLVFRGVAFPALRAAAGGAFGWFISGVLYGVFHYFVYPPAYAQGGITPFWYGMIAPILEGLIYGTVRAATGSTRAAMVAHMAFGLFALAKLLIMSG